jgi:hypothetical protein
MTLPLYFQGKSLRTTDWEAGWAPELVWKFWRREKSLAPAEIPFPHPLSHSLVAVPTAIFFLSELMHFSVKTLQNLCLKMVPFTKMCD